MPDQKMKCVDCSAEFTFTERDQEFYKSKAYTPPKRCRPCREKKKAQRGNQ